MGHNFESGFTVREPAWHGLATVLDDYPDSWDDARRAAGLDWEPTADPIYVRNTAGGFTTVDGHRAVRRSDTGAVLATVSDKYRPFPNSELGPLVEALLDEDDVRYETAGVLKGGRKVWVMLSLAEPFQVPGDPAGLTLPRLVVQNSHDGTAALRAQRVQTRIVCDNTSMAADREAKRHGYEHAFRHLGDVTARIGQAKMALAGLRDDRAAYVEWAADLLDIRVTPAQTELWLARFIPDPPTATDRTMANVTKARQAIRDVLASPTTADTAHTAYGLVQAGIEWLDHLRGFREPEVHLARTYLRREPGKVAAERLAREVAMV